MKKGIILLLLFTLFSSLFIGCTSNELTEDPANNQVGNTVTNTFTLYYGDSNNEEFVTEVRELTYSKDDDPYVVVLEELFKGPKNESYRNNISTETKVYGTIKQDNKIIINLSKEFGQFSGSMAELFAVGSIVNTLTSFEEIDQVKILVEGEELIGPIGEPRGFMDPFVKNSISHPAKTEEFTLYFGNSDATGVSPEKRAISVNGNESQEELTKLVLEGLVKGPDSKNLYRTIPPEVAVLSVKIENKIAYVDFSEEMHTKHWGGATGEALTIASIVNTLTEFEDIDLVKMTVVGQPLSIEHAILEDPVGRNEDMIVD